MAREKEKAPSFNDIVFELRNKEYGAYKLRKKYNRNVIIGVLIGVLLLGTAVITPHIYAKAMESKKAREERQVEMIMENLDQPTEQVAPPPPPPPPAEAQQQNRYVPPVVVDSVKPEDNVQLMTADQATVEVVNEEYIEAVEEVREEVQEEEAEPEPFVVVEEMPNSRADDDRTSQVYLRAYQLSGSCQGKQHPGQSNSQILCHSERNGQPDQHLKRR